MKPASEIISRPILTEKASGLAEANKYVFEILPGCDRAQVKTAIEAAFKVTVLKVNILIRKGKMRRAASAVARSTKRPARVVPSSP